MEMRLNDQNQWAFDGFLQTDKESLVLFDETKTHPANEWTHVAVVYNGSIMKTFVNGKEELRGTIGYNKAIVNALAKTSVGSRMNEKNWLLGFVKTARITHAAVDPKDFMPIHQTAIHEPYIPVRQNLIQCRYRGDGQIALDMCESITMPVQIQIMTAAGKRVLSALYPGTAPYMLNIDGLTNGFYLITADGETSSFSQKIRILR
jgi:hypothetical protein